jgi:periplasmic protein CpxP/Spy
VEFKQTTDQTTDNQTENMKSTKTLLIAALTAGALLTGSSALRAQQATNTPPTHEHGAGMKGHQDIAKQLDLTDDQKPKVEAIMKGAAEKGRTLRADTSLTPEDKKAKAKAIREETATQLKGVLTPEQFAKWQEMSKRGAHNRQLGDHSAQPSPKADTTAPPS